jgi:hypothetical protein
MRGSDNVTDYNRRDNSTKLATEIIIPPIVPTHSRGAINDGTVHATGAPAAKPPRETLIQNSRPISWEPRLDFAAQ